MSQPGVIELATVLKSVKPKVGKPMSNQAAKEIFPPVTLEAGRAKWTPRDKLARLVHLARQIGYYRDDEEGAEEAEERALFDEISAMLLEWEEWIRLA